MKMSFRDQLIVAVAGIVLVAVAFVVLLIVPQFTQLGQLDNDRRAAEASISDAKGLLARRQQAKTEAADTQSRILHLYNTMPDSPELPALIVEMQQMATDSGITLDQVAPKKPVASTGYSKIDIDFSVTGQWEDLLDYLRRLQTLQRGIRIIALTVNPGSAAPQYTSSVPVSTTVNAASDTSSSDPKHIFASVTIEAYTIDASSGTGATAPGAGTGKQ